MRSAFARSARALACAVALWVSSTPVAAIADDGGTTLDTMTIVRAAPQLEPAPAPAASDGGAPSATASTTLPGAPQPQVAMPPPPPTTMTTTTTATLAAPPPTPVIEAQLDLDATFEKGNQSYLHGDFKAAIDAYEQLVAAGIVHEDLYYALGNAYFKADRLGPAILNFERALSLEPDQDDANANLRLARQTAAQRWQDKLVGAEADPLWLRALSYFTPGGLTLLFLSLYGALFLLVLLVFFLPRGFLRVVVSALLIFVVLGAVGAGGLLAGRWWLANRADYGFVLADEVQVKEGPDTSYETSFVVHAGMRARAVSRDNEWVKLRLPNGLEGWVHERDFARL